MRLTAATLCVLAIATTGADSQGAGGTQVEFRAGISDAEAAYLEAQSEKCRRFEWKGKNRQSMTTDDAIELYNMSEALAATSEYLQMPEAQRRAFVNRFYRAVASDDAVARLLTATPSAQTTTSFRNSLRIFSKERIMETLGPELDMGKYADYSISRLRILADAGASMPGGDTVDKETERIRLAIVAKDVQRLMDESLAENKAGMTVSASQLSASAWVGVALLDFRRALSASQKKLGAPTPDAESYFQKALVKYTTAQRGLIVGDYYGAQELLKEAKKYLEAAPTPTSEAALRRVTGTLTDVDGNRYKTVAIGKAIWMAENLKTTKYNDGKAIQLVTFHLDWVHLKTPGRSLVDLGDTDNATNAYGMLYNWQAVNTRKLCPKGWHVPKAEEWSAMVAVLGGEDEAGRQMKATALWKSPNTATNSSEFSALPAGLRETSYGTCENVGMKAYFWTATAANEENALVRELYYGWAKVRQYPLRHELGLTVRCVKN